jgi:hypothetical protein
MKDLGHFLVNLSTMVSEVSDAVTIDSINQLKIDAAKTWEAFFNNLRILKKKIGYIPDILLEENTIAQQEAREIVKILEETVGKSLEELENYLNEQEKEKKDKLLFEGALIDLLIKVLESICQFWQKIDNLYPNLSGILIDYIGNLLIGLIATQMPVIALLISGSGVLDSIKSFLKVENLIKVADNWKSKLAKLEDKLLKMKKQPNLERIYQSAQLVAEISKETRLPTLYIAQLRLDNESLKRIHNLIKQNLKEKEAFIKIVNLSQEIPHSRGAVLETVAAIEKELAKTIEAIPEQGLELKTSVTRELLSAQGHLFASLDPTMSVIEKLNFCYKAAKSLASIPKQLQETCQSMIGGKEVLSSCQKMIMHQTRAIIPEALLKGAATLQSSLGTLSDLVQIVQISNVMKVLLTKGESKAIIRKR